MKKNYVIHPSMLGITSGALWFGTSSGDISVFDESKPLHIIAHKCSGSTICIWHISPIWQFNSPPGSSVAFLGDFGKWAPISRQRFTSLIMDSENSQARLTFQGVPGEEIFIFTFYPPLGTAGHACFVTGNGTGWATITSTILTCS